MNRAVLATFVIFNLPVFGFATELNAECPALQGRYSCVSGDDTQPLSVQQRIENTVSIFKVDFGGAVEEFIADGKSRTIDRDGEKMTYVSSCREGGEVFANIQSKTEDYEMSTDISLKQRPNRDLSVGIAMTTKADGEVVTNKQTLACKLLR